MIALTFLAHLNSCFFVRCLKGRLNIPLKVDKVALKCLLHLYLMPKGNQGGVKWASLKGLFQRRRATTEKALILVPNSSFPSQWDTKESLLR